MSRKDHKITEAETELLKRIGKTLLFEREFCDNAIREILENQYVLQTPPEFSTDELAMKFIKDGLTLAFSDKEVPAFEAEWLRATAEKNGLNVKWFIQQLKHVIKREEIHGRLEVDDLSVKHSWLDLQRFTSVKDITVSGLNNKKNCTCYKGMQFCVTQ